MEILQLKIKNEIVYSPNSAIDYAIKQLLVNFPESAIKKMAKAILSAKKAALKHQDENTDSAARHIFREFVVADYFNKQGFKFEYEIKIDGKTPDWFDKNKKLILESYTFERGGRSEFLERIESVITSKCNKYRNIAKTNNLHFAISVYLDFLTGVTLNECKEGYYDLSKLFIENSILDSIVFFSESSFVGQDQSYQYLSVSLSERKSETFSWPCEQKIL